MHFIKFLSLFLLISLLNSNVGFADGVISSKGFLLAEGSLLTKGSLLADGSRPHLIKTNKKKNEEYVRKRFLSLMKKPFIDKTYPEQQKIIIIGDSHAQDFLNAIIENNYLNQDQIVTRYIPTRCQIFLGENSRKNWLKADKKLCESSDNLNLARKQINEADVIILAAFWRKWATQALPSTLKNLQLKPEQILYVVGRRSFNTLKQGVNLNLRKDQFQRYRNKVDINQIEINKLMQSTLDKRIFIDAHKLVCGEGASCPVFTDKAKLISFDGGHLSKEGARYFGRIIFQKSPLKSLL